MTLVTDLGQGHKANLSREMGNQLTHRVNNLNPPLLVLLVGRTRKSESEGGGRLLSGAGYLQSKGCKTDHRRPRNPEKQPVVWNREFREDYNSGGEEHRRKDCKVVKCFGCGSLDHCVKDCKSRRKPTRRKQSTSSREQKKLTYNSSKTIDSRSVATSTTDLQNTKKTSRKCWPITRNQIYCRIQ